MPKSKFFTFILVVSVFLVFAASLAAEKLKKISLQEVLSIGSLDDDVLFQWTGVAVGGEMNIFVLDAMDYSLKKFNPAGKLIKKSGGKGQGPGEFIAPRLLDYSDASVYTTDQSILGFQVFDKDLNFKRRILIKMPISDFKILPGDQIAVSSISAEKRPALFIFGADGELVREISYSPKKMPLMMDMVSFDFDRENNLYVAYTFQDRIEKFSRGGDKIWTVKLLRERKVKKKKISSYVVPTEVMYKDLDFDNLGNLFILGGHLSKNRSRDVYVLDRDGKLLTVFTLPDASHCIYIDQMNFLYSRANEGVTLKKFKMNYTYE